MSALPSPSFRDQVRIVRPIFRNSLYAKDRRHSLGLLAAVCSEQQGRFHTLQLLSDYLASRTGRKRQAAASEMKALRDLHESTWCELSFAFPAELVRWARAAVEQWCETDASWQMRIRRNDLQRRIQL